MNCNRLIILRGPSGSGKSTYVQKNYPGAIVCAADDFFMVNGFYEFDPTKLPQAHQAAMSRVLSAVKDKAETIVVDGTHTQNWEWENYRKIGLLCGYEVIVVEFRPTTLEQIKNCIARNKHGVPPTAIAVQALRFEEYAGNDVTKVQGGME